MPDRVRPAGFPTSPSSSNRIPDWPAQKALRKHAEEALAGELDAVAADWFKRHPPVSPTGKLREAEIMMNSGDLEGGTARAAGALDHRGFRPARRKEFSCPARLFAATRGPCAADRSAVVGRADRGGAPHVAAGAAQLSSAGRGAPGARRASRKSRGARRAGSAAAALGPGARLRAAALAPQEGHDRCGGPNSARPAQRPRPPGGMVGGTASDCPTRSRRRQRRACLSARRAAWLDRRKRVLRSPVSLGLYRAALYEAAGARVRTFLAHPDAGRHPVCEGARRILGGTGRRGARQIRPRGEMVRRRGRPHGDLLRAARRAPARARCAAASDTGTCTRSWRSWPNSTATRWFVQPGFSSISATGPTARPF